MSTIKTKKVQLGTDASAANNFTLYQPATPDGTLRIGVGNADSPTEVSKITSNGIMPNVPTFYAYNNASQSISVTTWTKAEVPNIQYDTHNWFDTTNHRFTPQIEGYYWFSTYIRFAGTSMGQQNSHIYKNGGEHTQVGLSRDSSTCEQNGQTIMYMNGTTDYVELYGYISSGSSLSFGSAGVANVEGTRSSSGTRFQGFLIYAL